MRKTQWYVGARPDGWRDVIADFGRWTPEQNEMEWREAGYVYMIGPHRTKAGALTMAAYGNYGNPHLQTSDDADRIASQSRPGQWSPAVYLRQLAAELASANYRRIQSKEGLNR